MSVKTFADIFSPFLGDVKEIGYKTDITIGQRALEKIEKSPTMGLESMGAGEVEGSVRKNCAEFVMACESALSDLQRYNSVSLALAIKHRDVIGIEPNTANFTTQFSKKNYDMAVENLKGFLLIGASVAIAAGLGWLVYKMLTAKKEKGANGKPLKEISKEVTKASELFAAIDLTSLPKDVQDKYLELAKADANEMVKRVATDDHYLKDGFLLELSSICHDASFTNLEAMCFGREDGTWLVNFYNRHHGTFIKNIKDLIEVVEGVRNGIKGLDVTNIDIAVIEGRIDNAYHERQKDLDSLMRVIDLEGNGLEFEDIAEHLTRDPSFGPIEFVKRASKETVVANVKEFDTFNKAKDEVAKLGGELDKLTKDLEKLKSSVGDRMPNFDNGQVIEKLKVEVSEMEHIRNYVVRETSALGQTYKYIVAAAKRYASRINTVIEDLVDEGMKKDYRDKIKKAAQALPNRRIATESISEDGWEDLSDHYEMGTEALKGKHYLGIAAGLAAAGIIGYAIYRATSGTKAVSSKVDDVLKELEAELEKEEKKTEVEIVEEKSSSSTPKTTKLKTKTLDDLAESTHKACDIAKADGRDVLIDVMGVESLDSKTGKVKWEFKNEDMVAIIGEERLSSMSTMAAGLAINPAAAYSKIVMMTPATLPDVAAENLKGSLRGLDDLKEIFADVKGAEVNDFMSAFSLMSKVVTKAKGRIGSQMTRIYAAIHALDNNKEVLAALEDLREYIDAGGKGDNDLSETAEKIQKFKASVAELYSNQVYWGDCDVGKVLSTLGSKKVDFRDSIRQIRELNQTHSKINREVLALSTKNETALNNLDGGDEFKEKFDKALGFLREKVQEGAASDNATERLFKSSKVVKILPDVVALSLYMTSVTASNFGKLANAVISAVKIQRRVMKKILSAAGATKMATESIVDVDDYNYEHDKEAEEFLSLPEYEQAGYRFDPREGIDGANIMAMESWSMGAKVAIGIAAAVAILGIGALIASTLIKRSATADERHSGKEQDKQALNNAEVIERQIAEIDSRWKAIRGKVNSIEGFNKRYPDFEQTAQDVETRLRRLNNKTVDVNGVEVPAMQEVLESFGDKRGVMVRALLSTHLGKVTSPYCLSGVYNKYSAAITSYHRELVVKVLEMLREGRDPEAIIDYMERWYRGPEIKLMRDAMVESTRTLGEQQGQVDAYWLTATTIEYDTENYHRSQPMTVMSAASKSSENFSPIVKQLKDHLEQFTLPEDLVKQYEKSEAESKGTRDKVASILNRLAEFKPLFAQYVRVIRYELELIEELMGVKDRLLKAFTRYYRDNASELKDLHIKVADIEDQEWFKE